MRPSILNARSLHALSIAALSAGCNSQSLGKFNTAPSVSIVSPSDGELVDGGGIIQLVGVARDPQDDPTSLQILWTSNVADPAELGSDPPDVDGNVVQNVTGLAEGEHLLTLKAIDLDGASEIASVLITVGDVPDEEPEPEGSPPRASFVSPSEGAEFVIGDVVTFIAAVTDDDQAADTVAVSLVSVPDGLLWEGFPNADGLVDVDVSALSEGPAVVTLRATDATGQITEDVVEILMLSDGRPRVSIDSPAEGAAFDTTDAVVLRGTVSDRETDNEAIVVNWESSIQGTLFDGNPASTGETVVSTSLVEGTHVITLEALDSDGQAGSASRTLVITDPRNRDDDRDGFTENEGDCNDGDSSLSPGRYEDCNELDDNCDGYINEDWWDTYEPNETSAAPYDLGSVGGSFWAGSTASLAGLRFHEAGDQDWFRFDADDNSLLTLRINATAGTFATSGSYVLELWNLDGTPRVVSSTAGSGRLTINYNQSLFEDEDNWAVRVYAASWPYNCTSVYSVTISTTMAL